MSRSKRKHKQERKRRHERQIQEGVRQPRKRTEKRNTRTKVAIRLSSMDREIVKQVLDAVRDIEF